LPRGVKVRVRLGEIDLITLDVKGTVVERLDVAPAPLEAEEAEEAEEEPVAGPIAIAVDVSDEGEPEVADTPAAS
jgi:exoribonuclease II